MNNQSSSLSDFSGLVSDSEEELEIAKHKVIKAPKGFGKESKVVKTKSNEKLLDKPEIHNNSIVTVAEVHATQDKEDTSGHLLENINQSSGKADSVVHKNSQEICTTGSGVKRNKNVHHSSNLRQRALSESSLSDVSINFEFRMNRKPKRNLRSNAEQVKESMKQRTVKMKDYSMVSSTPLPGKKAGINNENWPSPIIKIPPKLTRQKNKNNLKNQVGSLINVVTSTPISKNKSDQHNKERPLVLQENAVSPKRSSPRKKNDAVEFITSTPLPGKHSHNEWSFRLTETTSKHNKSTDKSPPSKKNNIEKCINRSHDSSKEKTLTTKKMGHLSKDDDNSSQSETLTQSSPKKAETSAIRLRPDVKEPRSKSNKQIAKAKSDEDIRIKGSRKRKSYTDYETSIEEPFASVQKRLRGRPATRHQELLVEDDEDDIFSTPSDNLVSVRPKEANSPRSAKDTSAVSPNKSPRKPKSVKDTTVDSPKMGRKTKMPLVEKKSDSPKKSQPASDTAFISPNKADVRKKSKSAKNAVAESPKKERKIETTSVEGKTDSPKKSQIATSSVRNQRKRPPTTTNESAENDEDDIFTIPSTDNIMLVSSKEAKSAKDTSDVSPNKSPRKPKSVKDTTVESPKMGRKTKMPLVEKNSDSPKKSKSAKNAVAESPKRGRKIETTSVDENTDSPKKSRIATSSVRNQRKRSSTTKDESADIRRSKRTRVKPVSFWAGQRIKYRTGSDNCCEIVGVETGNTDFITWEKEKKSSLSARRHKKQEFEIADLKILKENQSIPKKNIISLPFEGIKCEIECFSTLRFDGNATEAPDGKVEVFTGIEAPGLEAGYMEFEPISSYEDPGSDDINFVFFVLVGKLIVTIHNVTKTLKKGDIFHVPKGTKCKMKNETDENVILTYTKYQV